MKNDKKNILHIVIIIIGAIFLSIPIFHTNLWFDESYSVAIANHSFQEIWSIGGHDVHPILYYWVLHVFNLIFGNNILVYRIFSYICVCLLGILGFTHIRKDFDKNIGIIFSFFCFFLPTIIVYVGEIRMYSFAMLMVTLMGIYAYRIFKNGDNLCIKNWIIFGLCSLASAYTHYYALITSGIVNMLLFIYFLNKSYKTKKILPQMKVFILCAVLQILLYIPWILSLILQIGQVSNGFWISVKSTIVLEFLTFQFTGSLESSNNIETIIAILLSIVILVPYIYNKFKKKDTFLKSEKNLKALKYAVLVYFSVIIVVCLISILMQRPIIYARYLLCITGLFIFILAYYLCNLKNKYILSIIVITCLCVSSIYLIKFCNENYDRTNYEPYTYLEENIKQDDIIIGSQNNCFSEFMISANYPDNYLYFYDAENWNVEEAYKAFGKQMKCIYSLEDIKNITGRMWVIDSLGYGLLEKIDKIYDVNIIDKKEFDTKYHGIQYSIALIEK